MREELAYAESLSKDSIHEKDVRVNQLQEELADRTVMLNANRCQQYLKASVYEAVRCADLVEEEFLVH